MLQLYFSKHPLYIVKSKDVTWFYSCIQNKCKIKHFKINVNEAGGRDFNRWFVNDYTYVRVSLHIYRLKQYNLYTF